MQNNTSIFSRICMAVVAIVAWCAAGLQFHITVHNFANLVFFLSFFTVLTNVIVAISFTAMLLFPASSAGKFFAHPPVSAAVTLYIVIVGLVYNTILRQLWQPEGLQFVADTLLHVLVPALALLYWAFLSNKKGLQWAGTIKWLAYPAAYLVYVLIRGAITGQYPYPFIDVSVLGYPKMLLNAVFMMVLFVGLGFLFVGIGKLTEKSRL
ncbi:MAG TPA: Pr6Pr family membrane protein [Chitinophagaceae bacterium]|nr:Pr6Pr family membrane protein [Chitinophagaceae bacterium]